MWRSYCILVFSFFAVCNLVLSQGISIKDASKKTIKKYKSIEGHVSAKKYDKALKEYQKLTEQNLNWIEPYLKRGSIYFDQEKYADAETEFLKVRELDPRFDSKVDFMIGLIQIKLEKYEEASHNLQAYIDQNPKDRRRLKRAKKLQQNAAFTANALKNPRQFKIDPLDTVFNSSALEYCPILSIDQSKLIFSRRIGSSEFIMVCDLDSNKVASNCHELRSVNLDNYEKGSISISPDGKVLYFASKSRSESFGSYDLFYSVYKNEEWSRPHNLGLRINDPTWDSQPSMSGDGQKIYFSSKRPGGYGGSDIYVSERGEDRRWKAAVNLGPEINTAGHDESPFIHPDHQTLYFRSNGHPGMGNYDLFLSRKNEDGTWGNVENLGYPVNTEADDGALSISLDGEKAYFTSDRMYKRDDPNKNLDILSFDLDPEIRPYPSTFIQLQVSDMESEEPLITRVEVVDNDNRKSLINTFTNKDGTTLFSVPTHRNFAMHISKSGYTFHSTHLPKIEGYDALQPYRMEVKLQRITAVEEKVEIAATPVILENIFFETGSATLLKQSSVEIDKLHQLLTDQPSISILITGHTDDVGSDQDNLILSNDRANAVLDALVSKGVAKERLRAEGKGESEPIADNTTEVGRKKNRRTTFQIVENK